MRADLLRRPAAAPSRRADPGQRGDRAGEVGRIGKPGAATRPVEACAGGGRIDPAVQALSDVVWPSDETGARDGESVTSRVLSTAAAGEGLLVEFALSSDTDLIVLDRLP